MRIPLVASRRAAWALLLCTWGALRVDALVRPTAAELLHSASPKPAATRAALGLASLASSTANDGRVVSLQRRAPSVGAAEAQDLLLSLTGLERGASATSEDGSRVAAAAAAFEASSPCKLQGDALINSLSGRWVMVYSSALERSSTGSRRERARRLLLDATRPELGEVSQTLRLRDDGGSRPAAILDEEVALKLPAPFPLPKQDLRFVFSQRVETVRLDKISRYRLDIEELAISRSEAGRRVLLPSPRKVLDAVLSQAGRLFPLELALLTELAWGGSTGRKRELTCTAMLMIANSGVRVTRSDQGELRIFELAEGSSSNARRPLALPVAAAQPVGMLDASGEPVEEFWVEGQNGLTDDWLGYADVVVDDV